LANQAVRTIDVPADVAYHQTTRYRALPVAALIPDLAKIGSVQFTANDGFVANIPGALLAGPGQAWLAIEPADSPWPALKPGGQSAGPFYLVWLSPEKGGISQEQWPYQIAKIAAAAPLETRYPQLLPDAGANNAARRGMQVYAANCATCHQINGGGDAAIGPDLNRPYSPTEYFQEAYFRMLIRNPASVRNWSQRLMPGFSNAVLSDAKLNDLIAYLRQMARQRKN
jgi:mono/diheme cytochrome c family protein